MKFDSSIQGNDLYTTVKKSVSVILKVEEEESIHTDESLTHELDRKYKAYGIDYLMLSERYLDKKSGSRERHI